MTHLRPSQRNRQAPPRQNNHRTCVGADLRVRPVAARGDAKIPTRLPWGTNAVRDRADTVVRLYQPNRSDNAYHLPGSNGSSSTARGARTSAHV